METNEKYHIDDFMFAIILQWKSAVMSGKQCNKFIISYSNEWIVHKSFQGLSCQYILMYAFTFIQV
jgi:hypothetical protein